MRNLRVVLVAVIVAVLCAGAAGLATTPRVEADYAYEKCGTLRFKGKHLLFAHRFPCGKAKRQAKFVLLHRHGPPHWKCSLAELRNGFAACHRGRRAWEFVPR
jgi:hypothetical protein